MRLALVFHGCHRRGGVERSVWEAARHWQGDHSVTVVAREIDTDQLSQVEVRRVQCDSAAGFAAAARRLYSVAEFDHVISFGVQDVPATVLWVNSVHRAWLEASLRFPGSHGLERWPVLRYLIPRNQRLLRLERNYFQRTSPRLIVVVAEQVGRDLTRLYGVSPDRMVVIHNGFDPEEFTPSTAGAARVRKELGLPAEAPLLLMVANELRRKGFEVVLEAMARAATAHHLLLAGRADPSAYADRIQHLGLTGRVHWIGPRNDIGRICQACEAFVLPTQYEAFCLAIVEALAAGVPVVTSPVPGAADLITPGANGWLLASPQDSGGLSAILAGPPLASARHDVAATVSALAWGDILTAALGRMVRLDDPPPASLGVGT